MRKHRTASSAPRIVLLTQVDVDEFCCSRTDLMKRGRIPVTPPFNYVSAPCSRSSMPPPAWVSAPKRQTPPEVNNRTDDDSEENDVFEDHSGFSSPQPDGFRGSFRLRRRLQPKLRSASCETRFGPPVSSESSSGGSDSTTPTASNGAGGVSASLFYRRRMKPLSVLKQMQKRYHRYT